MKRFISVTLSLLMVLSLCAVNTFAAGLTINVGVPATALNPGDSFEVPISLQDNPGIATVAFSVTLSSQLEWDTGGAAYDRENSSTHPYIDGRLGSFDAVTKPQTLSDKFNFYSEGNTTANGTVLTLKLKVKAAAAAGEATVTLNVVPNDVYDQNETNVAYSINTAPVMISIPITTVAVTLTEPVLGGAPQTTADGTGYTGTVSWSPAVADTFAPNTAYTATVTLTSGTYTPFSNPTVTLNGAPVTNATKSAATVSFTKTFPATAKALVTVTGAAATDRVYDKTTDIAITGASLTGVAQGDTVTIAGITGTVETADVGTNKPVTVNVTLGGASAANYDVAEVTDVTVNITKADITYAAPTATNIKVGSALTKFTTTAPNAGTGVGGESVSGAIAWYSDSLRTAEATASDVAGLAEGTTKTLYWTFTPASGNYDGKTGSTVFTIVTGDPQPMAFTQTAVTKTFGDANFTNAATHTPSDADTANGGISTRGAITYASNNTAVAEVAASTGAVTIKGAGTATITATAAAVPGTWAAGTASYTLTVGKKTPVLADLNTVAITEKEYNGAAQGITAPTKKTEGIGDITLKYSDSAVVPADAGTYTVKAVIAESTNYSAAEITLGTYTITPKSISISGAVIAAKVYNGTTAGTVSSVTFDGGAPTYTATAVFASANAGTDIAVTVTVTLTDTNYRLTSNTFETTADIAKATISGVNQNMNVLEGLAHTYTFDLTTLIPALAESQTTGAVTYSIASVTNTDSLLAVSPSGTVTSPLSVQAASVETGKTAVIAVTVSSANFNNFTANISIEAVASTPVEIGGITLTGRAYNGQPFTYTGTPTFTDTIKEEAVTGLTADALYVSTDEGGYSSSTAPTDVGAYTLTLSVSDDNPLYTGSNSYNFTITPAELTVKADNKSITLGEDLPDLTYTVRPALYGSDEWVTAPTASTNADNKKLGEYTITVTGGDAGSNYTMNYVDGTLTVNASNAETEWPKAPENTTGYTPGAITGSAVIPRVSISVDGDSISGGNTPVYYTGSDSGMVMSISTPISQFRRVQIGNLRLRENIDYIVREGSTIITLLPAYLDSLPAGEYTINAVFKNGTVPITFTVSAAETADTGAGEEIYDEMLPEAFPVAQTGIPVLIVMVLATLGVVWSRKRHSK
jgi:hypothetical protein